VLKRCVKPRGSPLPCQSGAHFGDADIVEIEFALLHEPREIADKAFSVALLTQPSREARGTILGYHCAAHTRR